MALGNVCVFVIPRNAGVGWDNNRIRKSKRFTAPPGRHAEYGITFNFSSVVSQVKARLCTSWHSHAEAGSDGIMLEPGHG